MTAPSLDIASVVNATSSSGTENVAGIDAGSLITITTTNTDASAPVITLTPTNITLEGQSGATVTLNEANADKVHNSATEKVRIWSVRVETVSASPSIAWSITNHTTPATGQGRTFQFSYTLPGSGNSWDVRANRVNRNGSFQGTGGQPNTLTMTGTLTSGPCLLVLGGLRASGTGSGTFDVDQDGVGEVSCFQDNISKGAIAYYDTGTAKRPSGNIDALNGTGTKTFIAVVYSLAAASVTGTASGVGGGTGAATGTQEAISSMFGTGGGAGAATGLTEIIGVAAGAGGGVGSGARDNTVLGTASGLGGGVGVITGTAVEVPPDRALVLNHNTLAVLEG